MTDPVTLTLARADAEMLRALIDRRNLYVWDDRQHAYRITPELVAALDAALAAPITISPATILNVARRINPNQKSDRWQCTETVKAVIDALEQEGFVLAAAKEKVE